MTGGVKVKPKLLVRWASTLKGRSVQRNRADRTRDACEGRLVLTMKGAIWRRCWQVGRVGPRCEVPKMLALVMVLVLSAGSAQCGVSGYRQPSSTLAPSYGPWKVGWRGNRKSPTVHDISTSCRLPPSSPPLLPVLRAAVAESITPPSRVECTAALASLSRIPWSRIASRRVAPRRAAPDH
jgi:hypothetical protein